MRVLVVDIGGSHVKVFARAQKDPIEIPSGVKMTPQTMMAEVRKAAVNWKYQAVSIGYPGRVRQNSLEEDAPNLGKGWVAFDFKRAFHCPVKIVNDAAMQALGSYEGGRMLFLGLGTGLGSALILEGVVHATEFGDLPYRDGRCYADYLGKAGLERLGKAEWSRHVKIAVKQLRAALQVDYVVLGGGKARLVNRLPRDLVLGDNSKAFVGGMRLWNRSLSLRSNKIVLA
jgi:predicted NBD/HSP70 family sugar kinase